MTVTQGRFQGVLFDLFGTVVVPFSMRGHEEGLERIGPVIGLDPDHCNSVWRSDYEDRVRGRSGAIEDQLQAMAAAVGSHIAAEPLRQAAIIYRERCDAMMEPVPTAWETLTALGGRGIPIGLVSNTAPDFAAAFERSGLRRFFASCTFSCDVGHAKPEREIYRAGADALGMRRDQLLFVGDGSDDELAGAERAGLKPALVDSNTIDTYDSKRDAVSNWTGIRFRDLTGALAWV